MTLASTANDSLRAQIRFLEELLIVKERALALQARRLQHEYAERRKLLELVERYQAVVDAVGERRACAGLIADALAAEQEVETDRAA